MFHSHMSAYSKGSPAIIHVHTKSKRFSLQYTHRVFYILGGGGICFCTIYEVCNPSIVVSDSCQLVKSMSNNPPTG